MMSYQYDAFISYSQKDGRWVEGTFLPRLEAAGCKICIHYRDFVPGKPASWNMSNAIKKSAHIFLILTPNWVKSTWTKFEGYLALKDDPIGEKPRVIIVYRKTCEIPEDLKMFTYVNFVEKKREKYAWEQIFKILGIKAPSTGTIFDTDELLLPSDMLPRGCYIPFPYSKIFTDREPQLKELVSKLKVDSSYGETTKIVALTGMGGVGKTQLAIEYCWRYGRRYNGVHWINARENIEAGIAKCGQEMGLEISSMSTEDLVRVTIDHWKEFPPRLIVLDNIDMMNGTDPQKVLWHWRTRLAGMHILITSRQLHWPADLPISCIPLETLSTNESLELLRKLALRLEQEPDNLLIEIVKRVDGLALALDLIGRQFNQEPELSPRDYLNYLDRAANPLEHISSMSLEEFSPTEHEPSIVATFQWSWNELINTGDILARDFFVTAGYLAPGVPIPRDVFSHIAGEGQFFEDQYVGTPRTDASIYHLQKLGLLSEKLSLHPLLAKFARLQTPKLAELSTLFDNLLASMESLFFQAFYPEADVSDAQLREHMEALAANLEKREDIERAVSLWIKLANYYVDLRELPAAVEAYQRAINIQENSNGDTAGLLNDLGTASRMSGDLPAAKSSFETALALSERAYGNEHPVLINILKNLGAVHQELGEWATSENYYERALYLNEKVYGKDHLDTIDILEYLGDAKQALGKFPDAKEQYEHALILLEKIGEYDTRFHVKIREKLDNIKNQIHPS